MKKFICLSLVLILICSCLSGCGLLAALTALTANVESEQSTFNAMEPNSYYDDSYSEEITEAPEIEAVSAAMDMENPIYEIYDMVLEDEYNTQHPFNVPQINCDTKDAKRINEEIEENYSKIIDDAMESQRVGVSISCEYVRWTLVQSSEYRFTLIISSGYPGDNRYYNLYNFDGLTGEEVTNEEILDEFGLSDDEFVALVKEAAQEKFLSRAGSFMETEADFANYLLEETLSDENINKDMPMFVAEDGTLCVIASVGSFAGASFYYEILEIL